MGHHGWQGNPPGTEQEARRRIVDAATACLDRAGLARTSLSDIATEAGVTRQTVYRYFPRLADILGAVAIARVEEFAVRMARHLTSFGSPAEVAVESVVFGVSAVPEDPYLSLLLQAGEGDFFTGAVTSREWLALGARILQDVPVDWASAGVRTEEDFAGLAEVLMRLFLSFLRSPSTPPHTDDQLRDLVGRWVAPALGGPGSMTSVMAGS